MNIVAKTLSVVVIGGGGLTSVYGVHYLISPKTLGDLLSSEEKILEQGNDAWNTLISKYKQHKQSKNPIEGVALTGTNDVETLRSACLKLFATPIKDLTEEQKSKKLKDLRDWCLASSKGTEPVASK